MAVNQPGFTKVVYRNFSGVGLFLAFASVVVGCFAAACFSGYMNANGHFLFAIAFVLFVLSTIV